MDTSTEVMTATFNSEALASGSYNQDTREMTLVVKGKVRKDGTRSLRSYTYTNVPLDVWENLVEAEYNGESAGRMWIFNIQPNYGLAAQA